MAPLFPTCWLVAMPAPRWWRSGRRRPRSSRNVGCGWRFSGPNGELGIAVPDGVIDDYERVLEHVDLASIAVRERVTRHDVKARIEEFNDLAATSMCTGDDEPGLTENVEQLQIRQSLQLVYARGSRLPLDWPNAP